MCTCRAGALARPSYAWSLTVGTTTVTIIVASHSSPRRPCLSPNNTKMSREDVSYAQWFDDLHAPAAAKVTTAVVRMEQGNLSNVKAVGSGVAECRVDFGAGYRVYFGRDGDQIIILMGGGTKRRQQRDINLAIERWLDYKRRKKLGEK